MNIPYPPDLPSGALISIICRCRNRVLAEWATHHGISSAVVSPLIYLSKHPDAIQDEISQRLMIDKAAITRAVQRLEEDGYLTRIPDETDRRRYRISLTETGKLLAREAREAADSIDRFITADLPDEARIHLLPILRSLAYTSSTLTYTKDTPGNDTK